MECQLRDISVYYEEYGEGRPIIMIHGYTIDHRMMVGCMEPILNTIQGYKRIYLDLPGMGRTKGEQWITSSDKMLEVVLQFIEKVIPGQRYLLAGESYGGYLARGVAYHQANNIDGLFLLCPVVKERDNNRTLPQKTVLVRNKSLLGGLSKEEAEGFEEMSVVQSMEILERYKSEILSGVNMADMGFLEKLRENYYFSFEAGLIDHKYEKPALFILGRQDSCVGYKDAWDILEKYPRATFAVLDRAGHNLQFEQVDLFEAMVKEWLFRIKESLQV
ncbi:alpha/beta fold hydrolase [Ruminiclostridium cellobioparum]|uniref:Putative hydrolases or acyltransferases (Alpha/beta hydrolase superfamily) n=1 Tax=Ruminiclostridium cellobioparum subsp. termitidis CT1112 TaxID=1195236 RepID=S0FIB7_RUMCE|nr:alpha/beta hydrolase [Ruminiclostridium cellobioparum]EMS69821.1 putative hydrolases or acyltransferases (alpha/beta hydrolase superfamily) [Ruminiclostridium cellobioparum subsp. termitidis CT1112]